MRSYCLKCRKNTESKTARMEKTNKGKLILLRKYPGCDNKQSTFTKNRNQGDC